MPEMSRPLFSELGGLVRHVREALHRLEGAEGPMSITAAQIPVATAHLADLQRMTEEGALSVMTHTEILQEHHARVQRMLADLAPHVAPGKTRPHGYEQLQAVQALLAEDDAHLNEILTALSFQDLAAQRLQKVMMVLKDVQHKLLEVIVVFGMQGPHSKELAFDDSDAGLILQKLEAARTESLKQDLVDDILSSVEVPDPHERPGEA